VTSLLLTLAFAFVALVAAISLLAVAFIRGKSKIRSKANRSNALKKQTEDGIDEKQASQLPKPDSKKK
jgi:Flp pilus assembly protein TadB